MSPIRREHEIDSEPQALLAEIHPALVYLSTSLNSKYASLHLDSYVAILSLAQFAYPAGFP